ncbi:DUF523 domain-containing protein [Treponema zioleckii]|uniref:DUF523 domain-containing protein n=1 Tax=Treponema zioleckii TaxID=331680 RepID=UPI00168AA36C|nr:DUF523 domain-containing protein [Treponema zioleckii]
MNEKENVLVSACLLGVACRYDGCPKPCKSVLDLKEKYNLIPVCPEIFGGLATPRPPCEIKNGRVVTKAGEDKTEFYERGANEVLKLAKIFNAKKAILKENSPSCGHGHIYDGSFTRTLVNGNGITAGLLEANEIEIRGESEC